MKVLCSFLNILTALALMAFPLRVASASSAESLLEQYEDEAQDVHSRLQLMTADEVHQYRQKWITRLNAAIPDLPPKNDITGKLMFELLALEDAEEMPEAALDVMNILIDRGTHLLPRESLLEERAELGLRISSKSTGLTKAQADAIADYFTQAYTSLDQDHSVFSRYAFIQKYLRFLVQRKEHARAIAMCVQSANELKKLAVDDPSDFTKVTNGAASMSAGWFLLQSLDIAKDENNVEVALALLPPFLKLDLPVPGGKYAPLVRIAQMLPAEERRRQLLDTIVNGKENNLSTDDKFHIWDYLATSLISDEQYGKAVVYLDKIIKAPEFTMPSVSADRRVYTFNELVLQKMAACLNKLGAEKESLEIMNKLNALHELHP